MSNEIGFMVRVCGHQPRFAVTERDAGLTERVNQMADPVNGISGRRPQNRTMRHSLTGGVFIAIPLLLQIPYGFLTVRYAYPDILRRNPAEVLSRFAAGGPLLEAIWYLYGLLLLPLLIAIAYLPLIWPDRPRLGAITLVGVASALVQIVGLLRWKFIVPVLAELLARNPGDAGVLLAFRVQHELLGTMLGEHIGQMLLAAWTAGVSWDLPSKWLRGAGFLAALLFVVRLDAVGFMLWCVWSVLLGWQVRKAGRVAESPGA
ncbi:MAG: DUF4386 domain-containing protein [Bryobacteraceae bacterium]|nr:DUF4386 domain-containing protein [Bryobacteraceae bacterium]